MDKDKIDKYTYCGSIDISGKFTFERGGFQLCGYSLYVNAFNDLEIIVL